MLHGQTRMVGEAMQLDGFKHPHNAWTGSRPEWRLFQGMDLRHCAGIGASRNLERGVGFG